MEDEDGISFTSKGFMGKLLPPEVELRKIVLEGNIFEHYYS